MLDRLFKIYVDMIIANILQLYTVNLEHDLICFELAFTGREPLDTREHHGCSLP